MCTCPSTFDRYGVGMGESWIGRTTYGFLGYRVWVLRDALPNTSRPGRRLQPINCGDFVGIDNPQLPIYGVEEVTGPPYSDLV